MATIKEFEDLKTIALSRELCKKIFEFIRRDPFRKDYPLVHQINGASGSIMDNIAEGFGRGSKAEFIQFLSYSRGSCNEVKAQLLRAIDRNYISKEEFDMTYGMADTISRGNKKLIEYLNQCIYKGEKFKNRN